MLTVLVDINKASVIITKIRRDVSPVWMTRRSSDI